MSKLSFKENKEGVSVALIKIAKTEAEKKNESLCKGRAFEYELKESEKGFVHVELETVDIDPNTFEKRSKPAVCQFDIQTWNATVRHNLKKFGHTHIRIIHLPEGADPKITDPVKKETKLEKKTA